MRAAIRKTPLAYGAAISERGAAKKGEKQNVSSRIHGRKKQQIHANNGEFNRSYKNATQRPKKGVRGIKIFIKRKKRIGSRRAAIMQIKNSE